MSRLSELMAEFCPYGVEYKSLGELGEFYGGLTGKCKNDFVDGNAKFISYMNVYSNSATKLDVDDTVKMEMCERQNAIQYGDVLFTGSSETQDECAISSVVSKEPAEKIYLNSFCFGFRIANRSLFVPDFLKYWLRSAAARQQLIKTASGVTRFNVSKKKMGSVQIPIPPLAVQEEIVRLLDAYTNEVETLTAELEAELAARRKQYEQYRDKLLTFGDDVERKSLGEIGTSFVRGNGIKRDEVTVDGVPCVRYGEIYTTYDIGFDTCISHTTSEVVKRAKSFEYGDILFAITGEKIEDIAKCTAYLGHEKCYAGGDVVVMKHNQNPKYMAYVLSTANAQKQKSKGKTKSKVVQSSVPALKSIMVPLPPLAEQKRIVEILDKFDALCNDATEGLAAEIAARKKQYEYYRDKLLTFKKAS